MHQSLAGSSIYSSGRAPQRTTISVNTPIVCMVLFDIYLIVSSCIHRATQDRNPGCRGDTTKKYTFIAILLSYSEWNAQLSGLWGCYSGYDFQ